MSAILFVLVWRKVELKRGAQKQRAWSTGGGRLVIRHHLSGKWHSQKKKKKTLFEFYETFYQKKPATGLQPTMFWQLCWKKISGFDVLSCGLIVRKWNQWENGADGLVPLICRNSLDWSAHRLRITSSKLKGMDYFTRAGVSAVFDSQSSVCKLTENSPLWWDCCRVTLDQFHLSNLCLSILAMLTFLSKFWQERLWQTFEWLFYPGAMTGTWTKPSWVRFWELSLTELTENLPAHDRFWHHPGLRCYFFMSLMFESCVNISGRVWSSYHSQKKKKWGTWSGAIIICQNGNYSMKLEKKKLKLTLFIVLSTGIFFILKEGIAKRIQ